jgi:hypothetical protein
MNDSSVKSAPVCDDERFDFFAHSLARNADDGDERDAGASSSLLQSRG